MHEVSLGGTIRDYLTGEEVPETTYEEVRQALCRMLVEEKGYPRERLDTKIGVRFPIDGEIYCRVVDIIAHDEQGRAILIIIFTSGKPATYDRETVAAARLLKPSPAPLAIATDSFEAVLLETKTGATLAHDKDAIPTYAELLGMLPESFPEQLSGTRLEREQRILYTYSEFLSSCCEGTCNPIPK